MSLNHHQDEQIHDRFADLEAKREREQKRFYARSPKPIQRAITQVMVRKGYGRQQATGHLEQAWRQAVGESFADATAVGKLYRGTLQVFVANSTIQQEIMFVQQEILKRLHQAVGNRDIRNLRFQVNASATG